MRLKVCLHFAMLCSAFVNIACTQDLEPGFVSLYNGENLDGWHIEEGDDRAFYVNHGLIYCDGKANFPTWLRSEKQYENFDLRFEFRMRGWCNSGIFFHAPRHGRNSLAGFEFQIDHFRSGELTKESCGAIFGFVPPLKHAIGPDGSWNDGRILVDGPRLQCWINGELVQDLNIDEHEDLKYRLRSGYIGIQALGYKAWLRNIRIKELPPSGIEWIALFNGENLDGWYIEGEGAKWMVRDGVIHAEENGSYLVSEGEFEDFELQTYVRTSRHANGGIFIRWNTLRGRDRGNEVQIENIPDSNDPTGSLYNIIRAQQPRYDDEEWFLMQIRAKGSHLVIRVNGETVVDYDKLPTVRSGHISLQMHKDGAWIEWKDMKIRRL